MSNYLDEKEKAYLMEVLNEIGTWADDIEEHFYKDGEEIQPPKEDEDGVSQKTIYYEDGVRKYEINSNGVETQIIEYDENEEEVEKFYLDEDQLLEILDV